MPGNLWLDVLQVDGHANHFTLVEGWRDHKAFDASLMAASTRDFRQKITPLEGALYDESALPRAAVAHGWDEKRQYRFL